MPCEAAFASLTSNERFTTSSNHIVQCSSFTPGCSIWRISTSTGVEERRQRYKERKPGQRPKGALTYLADIKPSAVRDPASLLPDTFKVGSVPIQQHLVNLVGCVQNMGGCLGKLI